MLLCRVVAVGLGAAPPPLGVWLGTCRLTSAPLRPVCPAEICDPTRDFKFSSMKTKDVKGEGEALLAGSVGRTRVSSSQGHEFKPQVAMELTYREA